MDRMTMSMRIEAALEGAVIRASAGQAPPLLVETLRYALFPGGARVRPQLCLAVAQACGDDHPALADAAAAAVEMLHCASLVHDDLPCFDNAPLRRGKPSLHMVYGEPLALLCGDALIVMAFDALARAGATAPALLAPLVSTVARGVGLPGGAVAGQAWESEPDPQVEPYHAAKTGALFVAALMAGAIAAGADPLPWRRLGEALGAAYQVADDLFDAFNDQSLSDKPVGQDAALKRPSMVAQLGLKGAHERLQSLVAEAVDAIPPCKGENTLRELVRIQATRLVPKQLAQSAA
jgi:geranylgeranyl diphosphate synthase type II